MQSQIEYELDVLKSGNYDQALQFIEHLVNVLVRMANALTDNEKITNRVPQQEDDNFWGYTFNFIAKVVDFELDAMYAVTYRNNQLTLLFNPKEIEDDYTVETMLEGLRHEGYHLLFNHLNVHKNLDNYMSNLAADCEINQHLEKPHKHYSRYSLHVATLCDRRVSVYHCAVHGIIYRRSYYFRSKAPKRQLVDKRRRLLHKHHMQLVLSDRSIFVVHIRARYIHSKRRVESTIN